MRRKNHRRHVNAKSFPKSVAVLAIMVVGLAMMYARLYLVCEQLGNELGKGESELKKLNQILQHESILWRDNFTSEKIKSALKSHGLKMNYPGQDQIVRMDKNGKPVNNQLSMNLFRKNKQVQTSIAGR